MKILGAAALFTALMLVTGEGRPHNVPNSEHNRVHAVTYAFCGSLKPCRRGDDAILTFNCESGGKLWPWARNGQYLGFAQMGEFARSYVARRGVPWAWGPWQQARSAARLQSDLGWSQWECAYIVGVL